MGVVFGEKSTMRLDEKVRVGTSYRDGKGIIRLICFWWGIAPLTLSSPFSAKKESFITQLTLFSIFNENFQDSNFILPIIKGGKSNSNSVLL